MVEDIPPSPAPLADIDTPALVLRRAALQRNIKRMAALFQGTHVRLRPHFKSNKCTHIARLQMEAGATGITCAKLGEAEVLADAGIVDILIANQIVGPIKIARLMDLAHRADIMVAVDNSDNVAELSEAADRAGVEIRVLVEVDVGMRRCGVRPGEPALELARQITAAPGLRFMGLQAYEGHLQEVRALDERRRRTLQDLRAATETRRLIEAAGIEVTIVSGGGTGTHAITGFLEGIDELQVGSYATMDAEYASVGGVHFEHALTVLAMVISRPDEARAIIDCGLKAVTPEFGVPGVVLPGATYSEFSEEHGELLLEGEARELRIGDKVELIPSHGCTTCNLYDELHVLDEHDRLVARWPIEGRGKVR